MKIDNTQGELIKRIFVGTAVWEEKQRLAKHENVKRKMLQQWDSVEGLPEAKDIEDRIWENIRCHFDESGKEKCRRISIMRVAIVAACLILLCGTGLWWLVQDDNIVSPVQIETITYNDVYAHESKLHVLPDSSKVWMKAGSHLRYANDFTRHRKIWLDGEAVFEVTKKYGMPFQVHIDRAFVEVKGTVFNVATNLGETDEVSLYEGAVEFNLMNEKQKVLMCPGQRIVYNADNESFQLENIESDKDENLKIDNKMFIEWALRELSEEYKEVIILYYFEELKLKDIAKILNIGLPLVKYRLRQAKMQLKELLEKHLKCIPPVKNTFLKYFPESTLALLTTGLDGEKLYNALQGNEEVRNNLSINDAEEQQLLDEMVSSGNLELTAEVDSDAFREKMSASYDLFEKDYGSTFIDMLQAE